MILRTSRKRPENRHTERETQESGSSPHTTVLPPHPQNDATLALELPMASLPCAREYLLIFFPLAEGRRRPAHSRLLYPLLAHGNAGTDTACGPMALRAAVREAQCSAEGESVSLPGARLGTSFSHHRSGRPSSCSFPGDVSSAAQSALNTLPRKSPLTVHASLELP